MGSCAAPSAKGDDKFITTDYLQQCPRHYYPELPPRVEYELTERGCSMLEPLAGFTRWIRDTWQDIEASRRAYDEAEHRSNEVEGKTFRQE